MATGMYTAVSGAVAQSQAVDSVANNLANADTLGFKKDLPNFKEYIATEETSHEYPVVDKGQVTDKDLHPIFDKDQSHVVVKGTHTLHTQGTLKVTHSPLDIALEGPGYLEVITPKGIRYTRAGALKMQGDGRLTTPEGYPVLNQSTESSNAQDPNSIPQNTPTRSLASVVSTLMGEGKNPLESPEVAARFINLSNKPGISINEKGEVYAGDESLGKLSIIEFSDKNYLRKTGNNLFENKNQEMNIAKNSDRTQVQQGVLEFSNVNPVEEMANLIKANRLFENDLKVLKTFGELMGKEANEIGR
jgi:flagellar basal-body rod protein FlgG